MKDVKMNTNTNMNVNFDNNNNQYFKKNGNSSMNFNENIHFNINSYEDEKIVSNTKMNLINEEIGTKTYIKDNENNLKYKFTKKFIATKWKGKNNYCCFMTFFVSTNFYYGLLTIAFILCYSLSFIFYVLNNSVSNYENNEKISIKKEFIEIAVVRYILILVEVILLSVVVIFSLLATFVNPGFLSTNYIVENEVNTHKFLVRNFFILD